jgi:hypothetical protein
MIPDVYFWNWPATAWRLIKALAQAPADDWQVRVVVRSADGDDIVEAEIRAVTYDVDAHVITIEGA